MEIFPGADIYTSVIDRGYYDQELSQKVNSTFIQKLPFKSFLYRHYVPFSPLAFESLNLSDYDLVISMSAGCAKGVITLPKTFHLGIILTPPRYQWGGVPNVRASKLKRIFKFLTPLLDHYLRIWDIEASKRPDKLIAISKFIRKRVQKLYKRDSEVVYPGVNTDFYYSDVSCKREDFYLVVSRLYDYKRIDLAVKACQKLHKKLVIIGEGPDKKHLKSLVHNSGDKKDIIEFKGYLSDHKVRDYMRKAKALIFPGLEDFGLVPVEAMSCGTPVIGFNRGGVSETVQDGKTGVLFDTQTVNSLVKAIKKFEQKNFTCDIIKDRGHCFSKEKFKENIIQIINSELEK
jgi:glycosyltransferase involved in cell wall biosynthesis